MSKIRPAQTRQVLAVCEAIKCLEKARDHLKLADCPRALDKVRSALKSTEGALRHAHHRVMRTES